MNLSKSLNYLFLIGITAFMAAGVYLYKPISSSLSYYTISKPCGEPLSFSIGSIDTRFSITENDIARAAEAAASLWNKGGERVLIKQLKEDDDTDSSADIIIDFVYDERQERTDGELRFREQIRTEQNRLDQLQDRHYQKRSQFEDRSQNYLQLTDRIAKEVNELNRWVAEKNEDGGFTESEYEQFIQRKTEVEKKQSLVIQERNHLDDMAQTLNSEMEELNEKFKANNQLIERYNQEFAGDMRFTKATYQRIGNRGKITVNQFMNRRELGLILAHEMGHALGLDHLANPQSVMFSRMGAQDLYPVVQLTNEDRVAIQAVCR